jgi:hypothetical protein
LVELARAGVMLARWLVKNKRLFLEVIFYVRF